MRLTRLGTLCTIEISALSRYEPSSNGFFETRLISQCGIDPISENSRIEGENKLSLLSNFKFIGDPGGRWVRVVREDGCKF